MLTNKNKQKNHDTFGGYYKQGGKKKKNTSNDNMQWLQKNHCHESMRVKVIQDSSVDK